MALSRRQFLTRTGLITAGTLFAPNFLRNPFLRQALAQSMGDRYFVILFLDGGNDGLNTVSPIANGGIGTLRTAYEAARINLRLSASDLTTMQIADDPGTGTPLGLHPGFTGLKNLYDQGKVAVIQGCGYPEYNLSHDTSRRKWMTGAPIGSLPASGWIGQYLASFYGASDIPAVTAARSIAGEFQQTATSVLGIENLSQFSFPYDDFDELDNGAKDAVFSALYQSAFDSGQSLFSQLGNVGKSSLAAANTYPAVYDDYIADRPSWNSQYTTNSTSTKRALRDIAACIYGTANGAVDARFFQLANGGYDTHGDQGTTASTDAHQRLHKEIGDAIEIFYNDLADMGVANKTTLIVWSEFSRRIPENESNGTDHGSQGPMFVVGGSVNGGVYGNHPDINEASLDDNQITVYSQAPGDPHRSTDFRDVYGTILKHWLNVPNPAAYLPLDPADKDPNTYWRTANFDMGFV